MIYTITNEQHFQVLSDSFSVSPSETGYELYFSANGIDFSPFTTVAAGQNKQFVNMSNGNYYYLSGNVGTVEVNWERECHGGGGGGGTAGVSSIDGETGALTTKTIGGESILGEGDIPLGGGSDFTMEYNQIREIEHNDYVSYTFKYTPETVDIWQNTRYEAQLFTVTYSGNSYTVFAQLRRSEPYIAFGSRGGGAYYNGINYSQSPSQENAYFSRPINAGSQYFTNLPDLYVEVYDDGSSYNWIFAVPQDYSVTVDVETYTGLQYIGTDALDFVEIAPAGAILITNDTIALPLMDKFKAYIFNHSAEEEFDIRTTSKMLRGNGDVILKAVSYEPANGSGYRQIGLVFADTENLTFWYKSWFGSSLQDFLGGKKQANIAFFNKLSGLSYDPSTDKFAFNGNVLSDNTAYGGIIDWGILGMTHSGDKNGSTFYLPNFYLRIQPPVIQTYVGIRDLSNPSIQFENISPITIGGAEFSAYVTFDYGEWVVSFYINGNNRCANFKMYHRKKVEAISQSDYDALVQAGTVDANTLYVII